MRRGLTFLLFLLALLILGAVFLSLKEDRQLRVSFGTPPVEVASDNPYAISASALTTATASSVLEEARYTGRDASGRTWEITAATATQNVTASQTELLLSTVSATLADTKKGQGLSLSAPSGTFLSGEENLTLTGGVTGRLE